MAEKGLKMRRHRTDIFSLVFGLILVSIGAVLTVTDTSPRLFDGDFLWPASLALVGLLLLAIGMARTATSSKAVTDGPPQEPDLGSHDEVPSE